MEESEILERLRRVLKKRLKVTDSMITPEASFIDDLGADSLGAVDLIMDIEDEFEIEISDEDLAGIKTVEDAAEHIKQSL